MHLTTYLGLADTGEQTLADSFRQVSRGHGDEPDVRELTERFAGQCDEHRRLLAPLTERYGEHAEEEPERLHADGLPGTRGGGVGLLRDLHDLYLLASYLDIAWTMVGQAARAVRDRELVDVVSTCEQDVQGQLAWLKTRMKAAAPQALVVG